MAPNIWFFKPENCYDFRLFQNVVMLFLDQAAYGPSHLGYYFEVILWDFNLGLSSFVGMNP